MALRRWMHYDTIIKIVRGKGACRFMSLPARLRAFGISKALDYLERDPDANLPNLMDWLDKYTG